jgi:hypothetical protein
MGSLLNLSKYVIQNFNHGVHEAAAVPITAIVVVATVVVAVIAGAAAAAANYFAASHPRTSGQHK